MKARVMSLVSLLIAVFVMVEIVHAGTVCINEVEWCNDVKLVYSDQEGEILNIFGYEYGCGFNTRLYSGSAKMVGNQVFIGLTGSYGTTSPNPGLALKNYTLNLNTGTGTGTWSYNTGSYWNGTSTIGLVTCPAPTADVVADGQDSAAR